MKFLIVGDLHGSIPKIHFKDFDAIIAPGDFCSDETKPLIFKALRARLEDPDFDLEWYDLIDKRKAKQMILKSVKNGRRVLEKLNSFNVPVFIVPGNWEWIECTNCEWKFLNKDHYTPMLKGLDNIINCHHTLIKFEEYNIIGYGISSGPEFPQNKKELKRYSKQKLKKTKKEFNNIIKYMSHLFKKAKHPTIFLSHNVPYNTPIDKITDKSSPRHGMHYGSVVTRKLIEKFQPVICIGGHMHEHFGKTKIKKTVCINTGFGPKVNTFLELDNNKIKKLKFYNK
ncbi:MAG: metallophosphoesterase [archaeon]